ncbi:MAG: peptidase [Hydrocarboniphaga sp.]|nr:peptidase [Hydrocarboniphaga sp.]
MMTDHHFASDRALRALPAAALLALYLLAAPCGAADSVPAQVITSTCPQPIYPPEALAANQTGTVLLSIHVSAEGKADQTEVAKSSGNPQLDAAAAASLGQCQFKPALSDGKPVATTTPLKYTFRIDTRSAEEVAAQQRMAASIMLLSMKIKIDAVADRCSLQKAPIAKITEDARSKWHKRNDATVHQAEQVQAALFAEFRSKISDPKLADEQIAKSKEQIKTMTERGADIELNNLESLSQDEQTAACGTFNDDTSGGRFDLVKVMPDAIAAIGTAVKPAVKPAAK